MEIYLRSPVRIAMLAAPPELVLAAPPEWPVMIGGCRCQCRAPGSSAGYWDLPICFCCQVPAVTPCIGLLLRVQDAALGRLYFYDRIEIGHILLLFNLCWPSCPTAWLRPAAPLSWDWHHTVHTQTFEQISPNPPGVQLTATDCWLREAWLRPTVPLSWDWHYTVHTETFEQTWPITLPDDWVPPPDDFSWLLRRCLAWRMKMRSVDCQDFLHSSNRNFHACRRRIYIYIII